MWYCVHALHYFKYIDGTQTEFLVWEHMYLINAASTSEAKRKGELRAKEDEGDSGASLMLNNRPARLEFITVRKVVQCQDLDEQLRMPTDGTELSYSEYLVSNQDDFEKLTNAETATVSYLGNDDDRE